MVGAMALFPIDELPDEQRILLHGVPWASYVSLRESLGRANRLTYLNGKLEIMTVGRTHEHARRMIARLLELFCLERDIPLFAYGMEPIKRQAKKRGLEPDEWYHRGRAGRIPALAIEVIVTHPLIDKLDVYAGLGVREVWTFEAGKFQILTLHGSRYRAVAASKILPEVDLARIAHYAVEEDQHAALVAFRRELRTS